MKTMSLPVLIAAAFLAGPIHAAQDVQSIPVSVTVKERFCLKMADGSLDFGEVRQGERARDRHIGFSATTNRNVTWSIQMHADPLEADGAVIPAESFRYQVIQTPGGRGAARGYQPVPRAVTTIYSADKDHAVVDDAPFRVGFKLEAPENQKTGRYTTTLHIRMTDDM